MSDVSDRREADTFQRAHLAVSLALDESLSLDDALPNILSGICDAKGWVLGAFWTLDHQRATLRCHTLRHRLDPSADEFVRRYRARELRRGEGLAGQAWATQAPFLQPDLRTDPSLAAIESAGAGHVGGGVAFPILNDKAMMGIMEFFTQDLLRPSASQLTMVAELGARIDRFIHDKHMERRLRQGQKMEALGRMAGGVAHDFNNLLTIINSWSELLVDETPPDSRVQQGLLQIGEAGNKAAALTRQLLAFSRHQLTKQHILDVNERVTDILTLMRPVIGETIELVVTLNPSVGAIQADPVQIEQVVMNLVVNAADAMPKGGRLCLETGECRLTASDPSWPDAPPPGDYVTLIVRDTGVGMSADIVSQIFEPFFTTKERGKGTGLGLSSAYGIIKQSGGAIHVDSEPGKGTTFTIYFPRVERPPDTASPDATPTTTHGKKETILLVEDDEMVRGLAKIVLETHQYHVIAAKNGQEALACSHAHAGGIALLVTDMVMPGMQGPQLALRLRQLRPNIKIVLTSGYLEREQDGLASFGPTAGFLQKPYTPDSLAEKVRAMLEAPAETSST